MRSTYKPLGEFLVEQGVISRAQLEHALTQQRKFYLPPKPVDNGPESLGEDAQVSAFARMMNVDVWHHDKDQPSESTVKLLPSNICRTEGLGPIRVENDSLVVAMADPGDLQTIDRIARLTRKRIKPLAGSKTAIMNVVDNVYPELSVGSALPKFSKDVQSQSSTSVGQNNLANINSTGDTSTVVSIVDQILSEALRLRTSDIHLEPCNDRIDVRFRIDGQLQRGLSLPIELLPSLVARIKIMASMDIVEYRIPQDGHLTHEFDGRTIDVRVSTLPNNYGQRIVLRILDKSMTLRSMSDIGFADQNLELFKDMIQKPWGLVIVTGPTGSGKTTTLYAAVNQLKGLSKNIMTCEDPVEYQIDGISQSGVNEKIGLTLAAMLRALMRQDPDIILVGEIRDKDTAETAIRASLTGHLVLSTMHSNDALSAVPRLIDMGIEPLLLSSSLIGVTAQRLVRTLCPSCREESEPTPEENAAYLTVNKESLTRCWRAVGCPKCDGSGYKGRCGVHEILPITPEIQRLISMGAPPDELKMVASVYGFRPVQADACDRVVSGQTTFGEIMRTIYFDTVASKSRHQAARAIDGPHLRIANG